MSSSSSSSVEPLRSLLDSMLGRLDALEGKVGISSPPLPPAQGAPATDDVPSAVKAYDEYIVSALNPLTKTCSELPGFESVGALLTSAFMGVRSVVDLASRCRRPGDVPGTLDPHLKPTRDALGDVRKARLDRKYDYHLKAVMEMAGCLSWVLVVPPPQAPPAFVREAVGSSDFWSNKIRKEYKSKEGDEAKVHIKFCNDLKKVVLDLAEYLKEFHATGLAWNPRGIPVEEFDSQSLPKEETKEEGSAPASKKAEGAGGLADFMAELATKKTSDGSSAATGLKKVTRDQQTWRKEYKKPSELPSGGGPPVLVTASAATAPPKGKKPKGPPRCEYQDRGHKWIVENQTSASNPNGVCEVVVSDPKQQVYIYNCANATINVTNKLKSIVIDKCQSTNVIFDSAISACEIVNSKKMKVQTKGLCPSFSIDTTDGCLVYLSEEALGDTSFVTSKSSEMNVSYPINEEGDSKEVPIPEQFVHKLVDGTMTSDVSDLYH